MCGNSDKPARWLIEWREPRLGEMGRPCDQPGKKWRAGGYLLSKAGCEKGPYRRVDLEAVHDGGHATGTVDCWGVA